MIGIEHLKIRCVIGDLDRERKNEQDIYLDVTVWGKRFDEMTKDHIEETVDYIALEQLCTQIAQKGSYYMLETLAVQLVDKILEAFPVKKVWVRIMKPQAISHAKGAFVEWEKEQ